MAVLKSKRKESQFEVIKHFYRLRKDITDLLLRDFGYNSDKAERKMEKMFGGKPYDELTDMRRKLKKLAFILEEKEFDKRYHSWFKSHYKIMSRQQRENMDILFENLKEEYLCMK